MGGARMIAQDWVGPDVEDEDVRAATDRRRHAIFKAWLWAPRHLIHRVQRNRHVEETKGPSELEKQPAGQSTQISAPIVETIPKDDNHYSSEVGDDTSQAFSRAATDVGMSPITSAAPTVVHDPANDHDDHHESPLSKTVRFSEQPSASPSILSHPRRRRFKRAFKDFLVQLCSPPSMSIIISFVVSLINPIKALFIHVPGTYMPDAPDGQPPLAFIMDTCTFVGAANVPLGLICLGSALARLKVPMTVSAWQAMPIGAISALSVAKIILSPILGVAICQGLTHAGVINEHDKVLRFVCM